MAITIAGFCWFGYKNVHSIYLKSAAVPIKIKEIP